MCLSKGLVLAPFPSWVHYQAPAEQWNTIASLSTSIVTVGPARVTLGRKDCEGKDSSPDVAGIVGGHAFWSGTTKPGPLEGAKQVEIEWRRDTNGVFLTFTRITSKWSPPLAG